MTIILFDTPENRLTFYPFTLTRPVCDLRFGILTLKEKWERWMGLPAFALTDNYLHLPFPQDDEFLYINAALVPGEGIIEVINQLAEGMGLKSAGHLLALRTTQRFNFPFAPDLHLFQVEELSKVLVLQYPWQLIELNDTAIREDFKLVTANRISAAVDPSNTIFGASQVFLEPGVNMRACTINAETGPVYIGESVLMMEGTLVRGPFAICHHSTAKMGSKLYSGTTIGPYCTAGGEIKNSVLLGYSNKGHDGYLGDAYIGEWCNLGAGTSNSNVKNTGGPVKMWNPAHGPDGIVVGIKAGMLMGDYTRCAINTSFNTGTVIGICCNIFQRGFPKKHLASFSWGNSVYEFEKAVTAIRRVKQFKGTPMLPSDREVLAWLYHHHNGSYKEQQIHENKYHN